VQTPVVSDFADHVYHLYVIRAKNLGRDRILNQLKENDIFGGIHYPIPLHYQKAYSHLEYKQGDFPICEQCCDEICSLPMFAELTQEDQQRIGDCLIGISKSVQV